VATAPTFQAAGTGTAGTSPAWPAHQVDDIAFLIVEGQANAIALTTANGFVNITNLTATGTRLAVYWCRATSSSMPAPVLAANSDHNVSQIITFRGCRKTGNPYDQTATSTNSTASTTLTLPGVTTTGDNHLIVGFMSSATDSSSAWHTAQSNANLTGLAERADFANNTGDGGGVAAVSGLKVSAGATGTTSNTVTSTTTCMLTLSLVGHDTVNAQVATGTWSGIPGTLTPGGVTVPAQIATGTFEAIPGAPDPGTPAGGGDTVNAQVATASWSAVPGTPTTGGVTVTAQVATATWAAVAGTITPGGVTVAARVATTAWSGVAGASTPGGATVTAQVATAAWSGVAGVPSAGGGSPQTVTAQVAAASWSSVAGTATPGAAVRGAQVATGTWSPIAGIVMVGGVTVVARPATGTWTPVPGTILAGGGGPTTVVAQPCTFTIEGVPGVVTARAGDDTLQWGELLVLHREIHRRQSLWSPVPEFFEPRRLPGR